MMNMAQKIREGKMLAASFVLMFTAVISAYAGDISDPALVFVRTDLTSFWRTATNCTISLPIEYPEGASSAILTVTGANYSKMYSELPDGMFELVLPPAVSPETENVFDLFLEFDNGVTRTAKLGLIHGVSSAAEGSTRCIVSANTLAWKKSMVRAVIPIPYGTEQFTVSVNGEVASMPDTGLNGAQGWYVLSPISYGDTVSLCLSTKMESYQASVRGIGKRFMISIR